MTTVGSAQQASAQVPLPRISIKFCTQCKWMLRATYFAQELLSTFSTSLGEVALIPSTGGIFTVEIVHASIPAYTLDRNGNQRSKGSIDAIETHQTQLWDRKTEGGFPETKQLKKLVRDIIDPSRDLGHVDRHVSSKLKLEDDNKDGLEGSASVPLDANLTSSSAAKGVELSEKTTVDIHQSPTATETATAESMVAEIMASFQLQHGDDSGPSKADSTPGIATSVTGKAANLATEIAESFKQSSSVRDELRDIGGGSGGLGTGSVQAEESHGLGKDKMVDVEEPAKKSQTTREECEDCG
ncbi:MAG: hypothetical protein L6R37_003770 [Teloschistes peruensis]|nr:MAG: hypothetical protein L6R37_003770 [Teloschistes peruensis]